MKNLKIASILFLLSTFILKFSSMLRDLVIATFFGDSYYADVYFAAMTIPNALILFLLTGMKDAFLPSYYKFDALGRGKEHLTNIVKGTFYMTLALSIVLAIASPFLIRFIYPSFGQFEHGFAIGSWTAIIYFVSLSIVGVNAVYEGYFDAKKKFSFSVFSQTSVVLTTIVVTLVWHESIGIIAVPLGYFIGTIISFLIKFAYIGPSQFLNYTQRINVDEVKQFYYIFIPVGLTIAVGQINLLVNMFFAARLGVEGTVSNLTYAFRLVSIPQAVFAVTIATIAFPLIAEAYNSGQFEKFKDGIVRGILFMLLLITPAIAGMVYLMPDIVSVIYERGKFTANTTAIVTSYSFFYIGSTFFYSIQAVVAKGFYTLEKGHYMMRIGMISVVLNIISNAIFSHYFGAIGIALSASIVAFLYSTLTFTSLWKLLGGLNSRMLLVNTGHIMIATALMVGAIYGVDAFITPLATIPLLHIIVIGIVGALVYFIVLLLLRNVLIRQLLPKRSTTSS